MPDIELMIGFDIVSNSAEGSAPPINFSRLILLVYLPTFLMHVGWGMIIPILPLFAMELGANVAMAGFIVAIKGFGPLIFNIPGGMAMTRMGNRRFLLLSTGAILVAGFLTGFSTSVAMLAILTFFIGGLQTVWMMSRVAYVRSVVPIHQRGRAISAIGGISRIGAFVGPIIGGLLGKRFSLASVFFAQACFVASVFLLFLPQRKYAEQLLPQKAEGKPLAAVGRMIRDHKRSFLTVGLVTIAFQAVRSAKQAIFPLWGDAIGLDVAAIGLIMGLSSAIDMTLFLPAGYVMDRWGRKWTAVPSLLIMALGLILIPLAQTFSLLLVVGLLIGIGNGLGSGIVMTLGTDLSPEKRTGEFMGIWFVVSGLGGVVGPALIGTLAQILTIGAASVVTAAIGALGAFYMYFFTRETLKRSDSQASAKTGKRGPVSKP